MDFGQYVPHFYHVLEGIVRGCQFNEKQEDHTLFFSHDGQWFISPEKLLNKEKKTNTHVFEAVTDVTAIRFDHNKLLVLSSQNPKIFEFYHDAILVIMNSFLVRIKLLTIENAEKRYLNLKETRPQLVSNVQKKHLAQFLGITPNSLSRILNKFKKS